MPEPKPVSHPAKFSTAVLDQIEKYIVDIPLRPLLILDPFAGIGGVHRLNTPSTSTYGIELEAEWADQHERNIVGDAQNVVEICRGRKWRINCIVTSPSYGNRMADHHEAKDTSKRITYKHKLGRDLSEGSGAGLQWGERYQDFHWKIWGECTRLIQKTPDRTGWFVLNCKDHVRKGEVQPVTAWHLDCLGAMGWSLQDISMVETPGMGFGQNRDLRAEEWVAIMKYQRR